MDTALLIIERVLLAALLGAIIGWERETEKKPAGLRTNMLVSIGAATFVLSGLFVYPKMDSVARSAANVITGIGFLGAGAIISKGLSIRGITTAAAIWISASVGVACALGQYALAIVTTILGFIILKIGKVEKKALRK